MMAIVCIFAVLATFAIFIAIADKVYSEATKWDMAASSMQTLGYSDLEIEMELGPRPKEEK